MSSFASNVYTATVPSGSAVSNAIEIGDDALVAIATTTANVTFLGSMDNVTYYNIADDQGDEYVVPCTSGYLVPLNLNNFLAPRWVKIRIGIASAPTVGVASVTAYVVTKEI
jgi:hypothetical protein